VPRHHGCSALTGLSSRAISGFYDRCAAIYDGVVGSRWFSPVVWKCPATAYDGWYRRAFDAAGDGLVLDVPCGSLVFSHAAHRARKAGATVLADRSTGMMRRARERLPQARLMRSDVTALPLGDGSCAAVICSGLLHVVGTSESIIDELHRVMAPGGRLFVYTLVRNGSRRGAAALWVLRLIGQAAPSESEAHVTAMIGRQFACELVERRGNMLFLSATAV
jgi:SAM-dependent methyltransferase